MAPDDRLIIAMKFWLDKEGKFVIGPGDIRLLTDLQNTKNLTLASKNCGYSYKYAWKKLKEIERKTGKPVAISKRGGFGGGGLVEVTPWGLNILETFKKIEIKIQTSIEQLNKEFAEELQISRDK